MDDEARATGLEAPDREPEGPRRGRETTGDTPEGPLTGSRPITPSTNARSLARPVFARYHNDGGTVPPPAGPPPTPAAEGSLSDRDRCRHPSPTRRAIPSGRAGHPDEVPACSSASAHRRRRCACACSATGSTASSPSRWDRCQRALLPPMRRLIHREPSSSVVPDQGVMVIHRGREAEQVLEKDGIAVQTFAKEAHRPNLVARLRPSSSSCV